MKLQNKFILALLPPVIFFLVGLGLWSARQATQGIHRASAEYLDGALHTFVSQELENRHQILVKNDLDKVPSFLNLYQKEAAQAAAAFKLLWPGHIFVFDFNGRLVFDTAEGDPKTMESGWRPILAEIKQSPDSNHGHLGDEMYYSTKFYPWDWQVFISIDDSEVHAAEKDIYIVTFFFTLGAAAVILATLSLIFRRFVVSPIGILREATDRISARLPVEKVPVARHDEIGFLARDIEKMARDISSYQRQLLQFTETLEVQVEERTAELVKSEAGLAKAQELAHIGSWEWDMSSGRITWSDETFRIFGYESQSFTPDYEKFISCLHPDDREWLQTEVETAIGEKRTYQIEHRIIRPNGDERMVREIGEASYDPEGRPVRMVGTVQDITDLAAAEAALRDSRQQLELALKASRIGIWYWDVIHDSLTWDTSMYHIFGLDPQNTVSDFTSFSSLLHPDDLERVNAAVEASLHQSRELNVDYRAVAEDGSIRHIIAMGAVLHDEAGTPLKMHGVCLDVTDRKQAETALRQSEERFRAIFESTSDSIVVWDKEYNYLFANQAAIEYVGATPEQIIGKNIRDGMGHMPDFMRLWMNRVDRAFEEGRPFRVEDANLVGNSKAYSESVVSPIIGQDGKVFAVGVVYRDITDRKLMEQAISEHAENLTRANLELTQKNIELDEFTYIASHDLQEPLRKLTAFSGLLQKDLGEDISERARVDLHYIVDAAGRMQTLVQDLLLLSRTGRAALKPTRISPKKCAQKALDTLSIRVAETGAGIEWDELPETVGDEALIIQLYQNLISNGLKFVGRDSPMIHLSCEYENGDIVLGVRDNGIGIKPEYCEQIFSPFKRLHSRSDYEGTGIGLAICRKIVEMHGGKIWVESIPDHGAHFKFTLQISERSVDNEQN